MKTIHVSASRSYDILIERGILTRAGEEIKKVCGAGEALIVSEDTVWPLYGETVLQSMENAGFDVTSFTFPHGEQSKNLSVYAEILNALAARHISRKGLIVALGGGVTGDMAGFAAATYLRGIRFVQIPTTLLSQVDSSVGGKTAVDLPAGKNLAGAFYQPELVLCDLDTLDSLPREIFLDGCAEVIKYAVLGNAPFFEELNCTPPHAQLEHIIETCVRMKRDIVAQDEFDRGQRQLLNLGHTFGHGIEACSGFAVSHGSAVAIGMAMIVRAAAQLGLCTAGTRDAVLALLRQYGLPVDCAYPVEQMLGTILHDKKASGGSINLIVPTAVGSCEIRKTPASEISDWLRAGGAK